MRVIQMTSRKGTYRPVANQFIITGLPAGTYTDNDGNKLRSGDAFQSYSTIIAFRDHQGTVYLDQEDWNYSRTTSAYRCIFLGETTPETKKKIKDGTYKLINLN